MLFSLIVFTAACERSRNEQSTNPSMSEKSMLTFKSADDFRLMVTKMGKMTDVELNDYESAQIGFVSMRSLFKKAMLEEEANYVSEDASRTELHSMSQTLIGSY